MHPYVLALTSPSDLIEEFKKIGVDEAGIRIMRPKGFLRAVKIHRLPSFWANILKQEMLSLGGDAAVSRGSITGKDKTTDCLLLGTLAQINRLEEKLRKQPFGLARLGAGIILALARLAETNVPFKIGRREFCFGQRTYCMAVLNVTPDSFSGDGLLDAGTREILAYSRDMVSQGADILDIGAESSRPGSRRIPVKEELARILPVVKTLAKKISIPVSIDTTKSEVARAALDLGADVVNDISALRFDRNMAKIIARYKAGVVLMHMQGTPFSMQRNPRYRDLMADIISFLETAIKRARDAGIAEDRIIIDPGIGFGKSTGDNLEILSRLSELRSLGRPVLVGLSRKQFIGKILDDAGVRQRQWGTAAAMSLSIAHGADIVRVHDIREMKEAALVADAIVRQHTLAP